MNFKSVLLASALIITGNLSVMAADVVYGEPAPVVTAPMFSWSGFYIGGQVGYGWGQSRFDDDLEIEPEGFLGGLYAGYNFAFADNIILGIDADVTYNDLDDDTENGNLSVESDLRWSGAIRARAGYAIDRFMPYIAGGVAFGNVENSLSSPVLDAYHSKTNTGYTVGGGFDYAATDNLILRLEYRYTDLGSSDYHFGFTDASVSNKFRTNELRLGVAYKF